MNIPGTEDFQTVVAAARKGEQEQYTPKTSQLKRSLVDEADIPGGEDRTPKRLQFEMVTPTPASKPTYQGMMHPTTPGGEEDFETDVFDAFSQLFENDEQAEVEDEDAFSYAEAPSATAPAFRAFPLPDDDFDLTDLDGWRVAGSLGMQESEKLAQDIRIKIVQIATNWTQALESPSLTPAQKQRSLRVFTDAMMFYLHETSKVLYNLTKKGVVTHWMEANMAVMQARAKIRNTRK